MPTAKFLIRDDSVDESDTAAYIHALRLLVRGIELHTPDLDREDYKEFRAALSAIHQKLVPAIPPLELSAIVGRALEALDRYHQRAGAALYSHSQELHANTAALSAALADMVATSYAALSKLREFQSHLADVEKVDDLRVLRNELAGCLKSLAADVDAHRKNSASLLASVTEDAKAIQISVGRVAAPAEADPVTGLPSRTAAEIALSETVDGHDQAHGQAMVAVFVLTRFKQLSSRFGYEEGNSLLAWLSTYVDSGADPEGGLYRWSGPALVVIFKRNAPLVRVRQEIRNLIGEMPAREIIIGTSTVAIPISVGWTVFPVCAPVEKLFRQLDTFVQGQVAADASEDQ